MWLGLAGKLDLIHLKLYAAADDVDASSQHFKDLLALNPTAKDLAPAQAWIATQDPTPAMTEAVTKVIAHVRAASR